ncbi:MAG: hypothetical protein H5T78_11655 [Nocardia sp.]|nr:hypothetical protein [Nocardia sp.]
MNAQLTDPSPGSGLGRLPRDIREWRKSWLVASGFPVWLAELVAAEPGFDLHALSQLVDSGCTPDLAVRILAPIPRPETAL